RAAASGAELIFLPEKWNLIGSAAQLREGAEPIEGGESVEAMAGWARRHGVAIVGGSITEERDGREKLSNTCCVVDADGELIDVYGKIHLFDVEAVVADVAGWRVDLSVCYDVRFPELYRILALEGATCLSVPAHFTTHTGKDHWEVLLRARAIENQAYVVAAAQTGLTLPEKPPAYGRALVADPWGIVLATAPDEIGVVTAEL